MRSVDYSDMNKSLTQREYPVLKRAPIAEAVIEFRVAQREGFDVESLAPLRDSLIADYPKVTLTRKFHGELRMGAVPSLEKYKDLHVGYRLERADGKCIVQFNSENFVFSRMPPYSVWGEFSNDAQKYWEMYVAVAKPSSVTRVATRFINKISLPIEGLDFDDYFTVAPKIPADLPQALTTFLSRVAVPINELDASAVVTVAIEDGEHAAKSVSVILDIDVFKEDSWETGDKSLFDLLSKFRHIKNQAFFSSVTNKTLELFT